MAYLALYRKYRPQSFSDVSGQSYIVKVLEQAISQNKVSHAYLFSGSRGTGKTTIAKLIAKLVNCDNRTDLIACNNCPSCLAYNGKTHPDIIEIDAASNNGVDEIREIRDNVGLMPVIGKYKVYIIDEVHMLSTGAFNALLKTLEEPPAHVIFILATTEFYKVPETIVSRCQCFEFSRLADDDIVKRLRFIADEEGIVVSDEILNLIAKYSDGGMRDAISMLDKLYCCSNEITVESFYDLKGIISQEEYADILDIIISKDVNKLIMKIDDLSLRGKNVLFVAEGLLEYIKDRVVLSFKNDSVDVNIDDLYLILNRLSELIFNMRKSNFPKTIFEVGLLSMIHFFDASNKNVTKADFNDSVSKDSVIVNKDFHVSKFKNNDKEVLNDQKIKIGDSKNKKNNDNVVVTNIVNKVSYDKDIRVKNAFCLADKSLLNSMRNTWNNFSDYLNDNVYSSVVSYLLDGVLRVAGERDVVISLKYDSLLDNANLNILKIEKLFEIVFKKFYHVAFILDSEWDVYKNNYINDKKNGVVYNYVEEVIKNDIISGESLPALEIGNNAKVAIDLFGDDVVEID